VASQLHGRDGPDGAVFTSSLFVGGFNPATVYDADLSAIDVPTLVVHHELDACNVTLFADVPAFMAALTHAKHLQLISFTGGGPAVGDPCGGSYYHGYIGMEAQAVAAIGAYIRAYSRPGQGHEHGQEH